MFFFRRTNVNDAVEECRNTTGAVLVDVREADEFRAGHIPGAVNAPLSAIEQVTLPKDKPLFVCCPRGAGSRQAVRRPKRMGYQFVKSINGIASCKGPLEKE